MREVGRGVRHHGPTRVQNTQGPREIGDWVAVAVTGDSRCYMDAQVISTGRIWILTCGEREVWNVEGIRVNSDFPMA